MKKRQRILIAQIKNSVREGWDEFYRAYRPFILRSIERNRLRSLVWEKREDIITDVATDTVFFVKKTLIVYSLNAVVLKITKAKKANTARAILSDRKRTAVSVNKNMPDSRKTREKELVDDEEKESHEMDKKHLKSCLRRLTKTQRYVISLYLQGKTWAEIARERKVKPSAITQIKNAALKKLEKCINELRRVQKAHHTI